MDRDYRSTIVSKNFAQRETPTVGVVMVGCGWWWGVGSGGVWGWCGGVVRMVMVVWGWCGGGVGWFGGGVVVVWGR